MLHCIHFALGSPILLEGGAQEGMYSSVSSRVDEPASHEQQLKLTPTRYLGRQDLPRQCAGPPARELLPLEQVRADRKLYRYNWRHCAQYNCTEPRQALDYLTLQCGPFVCAQLLNRRGPRTTKGRIRPPANPSRR